MCFDRNINGNRNVKFLGCDYLLVKRCMKITLVSGRFFQIFSEYANFNKEKLGNSHYTSETLKIKTQWLRNSQD
jgi:hypothetical protein